MKIPNRKKNERGMFALLSNEAWSRLKKAKEMTGKPYKRLLEDAIEQSWPTFGK